MKIVAVFAAIGLGSAPMTQVPESSHISQEEFEAVLLTVTNVNGVRQSTTFYACPDWHAADGVVRGIERANLSRDRSSRFAAQLRAAGCSGADGQPILRPFSLRAVSGVWLIASYQSGFDSLGNEQVYGVVALTVRNNGGEDVPGVYEVKF